MLWQKKFIEYLGFRVVAVFKPPEMVSAKEYREIIENATKNKALLVVDNLQSGTELGKKIASEIGGVEVALTNFPGLSPELVNMTEVMKYNAMKLAEALEYARVRNLNAEIGQLYEEVAKLRSLSNIWMFSFIASLIVNIVLIAIVAVLIAKLRRR